MENDLKSICERIHELVSDLAHGNAIYEGTEFEVVDVVSEELLESLGDAESIKKALRNMFFAGRILSEK